MTILTNEFLESFDISISNFDDSQTLPSEIYTSEEFLDFKLSPLYKKMRTSLANKVPFEVALKKHVESLLPPWIASIGSMRNFVFDEDGRNLTMPEETLETQRSVYDDAVDVILGFGEYV